MIGIPPSITQNQENASVNPRKNTSKIHRAGEIDRIFWKAVAEKWHVGKEKGGRPARTSAFSQNIFAFALFQVFPGPRRDIGFSFQTGIGRASRPLGEPDIDLILESSALFKDIGKKWRIGRDDVISGHPFIIVSELFQKFSFRDEAKMPIPAFSVIYERFVRIPFRAVRRLVLDDAIQP